jgi:hypothetical protein
VKGFPRLPKELAPLSLKYFIFIIFNFLCKNCSIFNHICTLGLNTPKPFGAPLFIESFPTIPSTSKGHHGLGDFDMANKLSSLINRCVVHTSLSNSSIINDLFLEKSSGT